MTEDFPLWTEIPHPGGPVEGRFFKMLFLAVGNERLRVGGRPFSVEGPSILCLNETEGAELPQGTEFQVVSFLPELINGSLTLDRLRGLFPQPIDVSSELDYYWAEAYLEGQRPGKPIRLPPDRAQKMVVWLKRLDAELNTRSCRFWKAWARSYLSEVLFALGETIHTDLSSQGTPGDRAERVAEYLRCEYSRSDLTLDHLSREFATNRTTLQKEFRRHTGRTVAHYLRSYRLSVARDLLEGSGRSVTEVASSVGFLDLTGFERAFSRHYGMTPRAYRKHGLGRNFPLAEKS